MLRQLIREWMLDRKYRLPRHWSNVELTRFAPMFSGNVVNVSAWNDDDKQGRKYCEYFTRAATYSITNYVSEARGFQGRSGEIFLDLSAELPSHLIESFDVVFNHTVLEHIYEIHRAFSNLCRMTRDVVILVVPFLQPMHADYGDYWRFTPLAISRMFEDNGLKLVYSSFNSHSAAAVYLFAIGSRHPDRWRERLGNSFTFVDPHRSGDGFENFVGCHAIPNRRYRLWMTLRRLTGFAIRRRN